MDIEDYKNADDFSIIDNNIILHIVNQLFNSINEFEKVDFISIDVAFISLHKVLPVAVTLLKDSGSLVALIKPQFEAGRDKVGKGGIVRDKAVHKEVLDRILHVAEDAGLYLHGLTYSPIKGTEGNIEFLGFFTKQVANAIAITSELLDNVVEEAHTL